MFFKQPISNFNKIEEWIKGAPSRCYFGMEVFKSFYKPLIDSKKEVQLTMSDIDVCCCCFLLAEFMLLKGTISSYAPPEKRANLVKLLADVYRSPISLERFCLTSEEFMSIYQVVDYCLLQMPDRKDKFSTALVLTTEGLINKKLDKVISDFITAFFEKNVRSLDFTVEFLNANRINEANAREFITLGWDQWSARK
jgi:hypothetical protein